MGQWRKSIHDYFKKAKELGLLGVKTTISIIKIGADRSTIESKLYKVPLIDKNNNIEYFNAYGIEKISTSIEAKEQKNGRTSKAFEDQKVRLNYLLDSNMQDFTLRKSNLQTTYF